MQITQVFLVSVFSILLEYFLKVNTFLSFLINSVYHNLCKMSKNMHIINKKRLFTIDFKPFLFLINIVIPAFYSVLEDFLIFLFFLKKVLDINTYWRAMKKRLADEGNESVTNCNELKIHQKKRLGCASLLFFNFYF